MDRRGLLRTGLALLGLGRLGVSEPSVLDSEPAQAGRERLLEVAREIMKAARYCALITLDGSGRAQARTMDAFPPENDMVVWFGTNPMSRKVKEIEKDPRVTLYYFDPQSQGYVTIHGTARLVNDPAEKKVRWKDDWKEFYPDRERNYLLIAVTPERIEVVSPKHGVVGGNAGWTPPAVSVPQRRPKP